MKKTLLTVLLFALVLALASCGGAQGDTEAFMDGSERVLVVWFAASGNTDAVAGTIAETLEADTFEIVPAEPYTSDDLNWHDRQSRVSREHSDESLRDVELETVTPEGWEDYDTVFLGYPIWWGIAAWPVSSFVAANDFEGKTVVPFCTSTSSGIGESGELLADIAGAGDWLPGTRFREHPSDDTVREWVQGLRLEGETENSQSASALAAVSEGGLVREQILEGADGPVHYSYILPENYYPGQKYPLVMTMPGYGQMWFGEDSSGSNISWNGFQNWADLDEPMIVVSAQLTDWNDKSARQANELAEYFIENFPVDTNRVYAAGYSAGGETMSRAVSMRPDLYAAYLHAASQWDGTYAPLAEQRVAVYIFMGQDDEYYGSQRARDAYAGLTDAYRAAGLTEDEINELIVLNVPDAAWFREKGVTNQHGGGSLIFEDKSVLAWITSHGAPRFRDVPEGSQYAEAVKYVYENGLMNGTGADTFSPGEPLSRAMIVTILHRAEGCPEAPAPAFRDVPAGTWYTEAVGWAAERGIVNGVGNGLFTPEEALTRQQLDLILKRYSGDSSGAWNPQGDATVVTRGEAAQRLMDYFENRETAAKPHLGDLPEAYAYGDWSYDLMNKKLPEPVGNQTVLNTVADPTDIQVLYLWEKDNVPAVTNFTSNMTGYFDDWDFRPYVTAIPVREGVTPKGAVVLMAGGAYQFRGNYTDSLPVADALRELGFVTFIVDYRLRPYNQEEGALDVARAVRWIRKNADVYGFDPDNIAVMGFSAGGIQAGEFLMHYDEDVTGDALDPDYVPDELDKVPAHATACGMIYAFYGRLSVGNMDPDWLREGDLPPTFYCYGTEDPFYRQFEQQYAVLENMGHPVDRLALQNWPHGFGAAGGWVETYADWLENVWNT